MFLDFCVVALKVWFYDMRLRHDIGLAIPVIDFESQATTKKRSSLKFNLFLKLRLFKSFRPLSKGTACNPVISIRVIPNVRTRGGQSAT